MTRRRVLREDFSTGEVAGAFVWLALGAAFSTLLEVVYLGAFITLPSGTRVALPVTIVVAFFFNMVLSRTALLWTRRAGLAAIPLGVWAAVFFVLMFGVSVTGDQLVGSNARSLLLLVAGVAGGSWPLVAGK